MSARIRLREASLPYEADIRVHTAISSPVAALQALYLEVAIGDRFHGVAEVRANVEFLTGIPAAEVAGVIRRLVDALDWSRPPEVLADDLGGLAGTHPPIARAAVESALVDGIATARGEPVAVVLGGSWSEAVETSNCLFWSSDEVFDRLAARYVGEGFRHLKVRIAIEDDFERDLSRLRRLRERYGADVDLAVDANGAWPLEVAKARLAALEPLALSYVEQPTPVGDWEAFRRLAAISPIPIMADESLGAPGGVEALARIGAPCLAHLKIVKAGGPRSLVAQARRLRDAGVGLMVGQMNEGAMATALAAHCAMAVEPEFRELYGCYGLLEDPASGLRFADGRVRLPPGPGTGVRFDATRTAPVWDTVRG